MYRVSTPLTVVFASSALLLGACSRSVPVPAVTGQLVEVGLNAGFVGKLTATTPRALGLPIDAPALHMNVKVRDAKGNPVAFKDGVYDPSNQGSTTLTLNTDNAFAQKVLLPAGSYTFENATKDGDTDEEGTALLAYGPASENQAVITAGKSNVTLKFHAVYDPKSSSLGFIRNTAQLFTNSTFDLGLFAKSNPVNGVSYAIPTSDITMDATPYSVAQGTINGASSKLGVNVTATGSTQTPSVTVNAHFKAWTQTGSDTAEQTSQTLTFTHAIAMETVSLDWSAPTNVTIAVPDSTTVGSAATVTGTAQDDVALASVRLYAGVQLVASSETQEQSGSVAPVAMKADGTWRTTWTPEKAGTFTLTVMATDTSGNETRAEKATTASVLEFNFIGQGVSPNPADGPYTLFDARFDITGRSPAGQFNPTSAAPIQYRVTVDNVNSCPVVQFRTVSRSVTYDYNFVGNQGASYTLNHNSTEPLEYTVVDACQPPTSTYYTVKITQP